ncbi:carbon-nitrogen hydrolase family protein [Saccharospirillum salsuginis]|uniref:Hydrolase n=1 Tax=Saccharospirillum salsuginis TaxID=418750 RepID=A0A918NFE1_9GAMM|nr:carbon-nitrogen hydrolase family protein [Saccharospirillum salsuginis]GGX63159.1 hydrolase [Saccharospirillum salsuginis]
MKWYLAQMISGPSVETNLDDVRRHFEQAADAGCDAIQLPEMFALFGVKENSFIANFESDFTGPVGTPLREMAREFGLWVVAGTVPVRVREESKPRARLHVLDAEGEVRAHYDKIHMFDAVVGDAQGRYRESDQYQSGGEPVTVDTPWGRWGLTVCYDLRFPELYRKLRDEDVDTFVAPSAFTWSTGRAHWEVLCRARAIENLCYVVATNQGGQHDAKRRTWGHSMGVDPWGEVSQVGEGEAGLVYDTDLDRLAEWRDNMPVQEHRRLR